MSDHENMEIEIEALSDDDLESVSGGHTNTSSGATCETTSGRCETSIGGTCNTTGGTCVNEKASFGHSDF